jgi:aspartate ammonia-lyase
MHQEVIVDGFSSQNNPTVPVISRAVGGVYANPQNIGRYTNDEFGIVTDLNASLGFNVTSWLTVTAGYNFIHMNSVVRPGFLIDGRVDSTVVPTAITYGGTPGPRNFFNLRTTDYFIHGVNFGFNLHF